MSSCKFFQNRSRLAAFDLIATDVTVFHFSAMLMRCLAAVGLLTYLLTYGLTDLHACSQSCVSYVVFIHPKRRFRTA